MEKLKVMAKAKARYILFKSKPHKDGTFPIVLRITKDRNRRYIFTKYSVSEDQWNTTKDEVQNHPNSQRLNNILKKQLTEADDVILDMDRDKKNLNSVQLKEKIKGASGGSFYALGVEYLSSKIKTKKYNQYISDKSKFKAFRAFLDAEKLGRDITTKDEEDKVVTVRDIDIKSVNISVVKKYKLYLETEKSAGESTVYNNLNVIRIVWNKAIEEELVDAKDYPFGKGKKKLQLRPGESQKIGLDENELELFEDVDISKNNPKIIKALKKNVKYVKDLPTHILQLIDARNAFMFSFSFAGMRCEDVLTARWSDFKNGRYYYIIGKNTKPVSVPVPDAVLPILDYYASRKTEGCEFIFPFLDSADSSNAKQFHSKVRTANKKINEGLETIAHVAGIDKAVSMHIARHTFGNLSKGTIPVEILQMLYRHSVITTTINYQKNFIHKQVDEGLLKIVNFRNRRPEAISA